MAASINLLPQKKLVNKSIAKTVRVLKGVGLSGLALIIILGVAGVATQYLLSRELSDLSADHEDIKQAVATLENAEQGLVLAKDRAQKVQEVLSTRRSEEIIKSHSEFVDTLPGSFSFRSARVEAQSSELGLVTTSSIDLKSVLDNLDSRGFSSVTIDELSFSPSTGYSLKLMLY